MKSFSTILRLLPVFLFLSATYNGYGQLYTFTNDSAGAYATVATHTTGVNMAYKNGASAPATACRHGFSATGLSTATTFATTLTADTMAVWAGTGYSMHVTGFSVDLRRSATGPTKARYAYSTDGGTTWVNQGTDQTPNNAGCDTMTTATWTTSFYVSYPKRLEFAVFGYDASSAFGTFQIENLIVNGSVVTTTGIEEVANDDNGLNVYPNPVTSDVHIAYHLNQDEQVNLSVYNTMGQQVVINSGLQNSGDHNYSAPVTAPGIYFVRLTIGNQTISRKFVKI